MTFLHGVEVIELTSGARTISTPASSVIGIIGTAQYADPVAFPLDTPVLITNPTQAKALLATAPANPAPGAQGTLYWAIGAIFEQAKTPIVVVRVAQVSTGAPQQQAEVVGDPIAGTGSYALVAAQSVVGVKPKLLIAPGFTDAYVVGVANPVVAALKAVAYKLRGIVIKDGPNESTTVALADQVIEGDMRVFMVDPFVKVTNSAGAIVTYPSSARIAGLIANNDQQNGFWWSPSNQIIQGIVGMARPIEFGLSDPSAESNLLNAMGVATIIQSGGFRLWGNRTGSTDPQWAFLSVRRTCDMIEDAVEAAYLWALDRPQSAQLLTDTVNELKAYLRSLLARGAVIGGTAWLDPDLNTSDVLQAGQAYIDYDAEPPAPLERLTFQAARNADYYAALVAAVNTAATAS